MSNNTVRASEIVEAAHVEDNTEKARNIDLAAPNCLDEIISLFPSLPEMCQQAVCANIEALAALIV